MSDSEILMFKLAAAWTVVALIGYTMSRFWRGMKEHGKKYRLVVMSEEPTEIIRLFADEMEGHQKNTQDFYETQRQYAYDAWYEAMSAAGGSYMYLATTPPEEMEADTIRWRATRIAMHMMHIADVYGNLAPISAVRLQEKKAK